MALGLGMSRVGRGKRLARHWAKVIIEASDMMYNLDTQRRVLTEVRDTIDRFLKRKKKEQG